MTSKKINPILLREQLARSQDLSFLTHILTLHDTSKEVDPKVFLDICNEAFVKIQNVTKQIDSEMSALQFNASTTDEPIHTKIERHAEGLNKVDDAVCKAMAEFEKASTANGRIGTRLQTCEAERKKLDVAQELIGYVKQLQESHSSNFKQLESMQGNELLFKLPFGLSNKSWGAIAIVSLTSFEIFMHDFSLTKIL